MVAWQCRGVDKVTAGEDKARVRRGGLGSVAARDMTLLPCLSYYQLKCHHDTRAGFGTIYQDKVPTSRKCPALLSLSSSGMWLPSSWLKQKTYAGHVEAIAISALLLQDVAVVVQCLPAQLQGALLGPLVVADPVTASLGSETPTLSK